MSSKAAIKVYHGFGHKHNMEVFGHVFGKKASFIHHSSRNPLVNLLALFRLFFMKPLAHVPVHIQWGGQVVHSHSEYDGFFRFSWNSVEETPAGWHDVEVKSTNEVSVSLGRGKIFVPHITQYGIISDIDDTVLVSHSATILKRLRELLFKSPAQRTIFKDTARYYQLLAQAHTTLDAPNAFFYVSSSEWNLYDYLRDIFSRHELPEGAFLLNQVKRWYQLWRTGKTKHEGKLLRILRIFEVFPNQHFILIGDNTQADPAIYAKLASKYAHRIFAVYIRNVVPAHQEQTKISLHQIEQLGIHTFLFKESIDAIEHSKSIGLI